MIEAIKGFKPKIHERAFVHPRATIIGNVDIDEGASIWPGVVLRGDMGLIRVGKNSSVQDGSICHTTLDYSESIIGDNVTIGHAVIIHGAIIEDGSLIGMGSTLLDRAIIGHASFVAAASLVTGRKVFPPNSFISGSPAQRVREVNDKERAICQSSVEHYLNVQKLYQA
jgi:carbonic anhydrase/acetyltransferase-like protein (isoleucine patch superfamily)